MNTAVQEITERLNMAGFECFMVGGSVRDYLLDRPAKDIDLVSNATPADIKQIFHLWPVLEIGEAFGIMTVVMGGTPYEIAQFRSDGKSTDNRHPDTVQFFTAEEMTIQEMLKADASRRDFTINACYMHPLTGELFLPFNANCDLHDKLIKFVGKPSSRINEDNLRILRAFRFMSQLEGFTIEPTSLAAIGDFFDMGRTLLGVSQERITAEISKILTGPNAFNTLKLMFEMKIMQHLIPELNVLDQDHNSHWHQEVLEPFGNSILAHTLLVFENINKQEIDGQDRLVLTLATIFHDIGKASVRERKNDGSDRFTNHDIVGAEITETILTKMKFSNEVIKRVIRLVRNHMRIKNIVFMKDIAKIRKLINEEDFNLLSILAHSDGMATSKNGICPNLEDVNKIEIAIENAINLYGQHLPDRIITGDTLINAGYKPNEKFKKALEIAFDQQLRGITSEKNLLGAAISYLN